MALLLPRSKSWVSRRSRVPAAASSGNHKKSPRFHSSKNPRDQYDEHEDHAEQRYRRAEPPGNSINILLRRSKTRQPFHGGAACSISMTVPAASQEIEPVL